MKKEADAGISRREFARRAALASATLTIAPGELLGAGKVKADAASLLDGEQQPGQPPLSAESQAEADARAHAVLSQYGKRLNEEQKADIRRLCLAAQRQVDRLRAYPLENADGPALYLKPLVEREKKHESAGAYAAGKAAAAAKKN